MPSRIVLFWIVVVAAGMASCGKEEQVIAPKPALQAPVFDQEFRRIWDDGLAEISHYETVRIRNGSLQKGTAIATLRRVNFSLDDRVAATVAKHPQTDLFPAMELHWVERIGDNLSEMTTVAVSMIPVDGRPAGVAVKTTFSSQSTAGQLFHQLLFDSTGVRSHQYSYVDGEADEQITLAYPADGVDGEALWLWARGMAAPSLQPGARKAVMLLPALAAARTGHQPLAWVRAALSREADGIHYDVKPEQGPSRTFQMEAAAPYRVLEWTSSNGERAHFISSTREK